MSRSPAAEARARPGRPRAQVADRHIGARLRERRIMLGLTQQRLAELVGITYQQAHKYEKGINRISAGRLHAIARALGVEPGHFFAGLGPGVPARPTTPSRRTLGLVRDFVALPPREQEAVAELVRTLTGGRAGRRLAAARPRMHPRRCPAASARGPPREGRPFLFRRPMPHVCLSPGGAVGPPVVLLHALDLGLHAPG